jgi:MFS family permease
MDPTRSTPESAPDELALRAVLRRILVAWFFGAAWMSLTTGAVLTRFAKSIGLSEFGFGVLAAIPFLAALAQLPASYMLERIGHRKRIFLVANVLHRTLWLAIAAIPWVVPRAAQPAGLVTLMIVSAVLNNVTAPAWYSWLVDLVPSRIRGRYFSRRTQAGQLVNLTLAVAAGVALDWAEQRSGLALSRMIGALLAAAAVLGLVDILAFLRIPDPDPPAPRRSVGWGEMVCEPLGNRSFRYYLAFTATLTFSTGYIGQFGWLYVLDVCHASNMQATLALVTVPQLVALCSIPFWGRMVDRLGCKPVATIACACIIHGAAAWILVRPGHWFPGYIGVLVAAFAWPGVELASYNIMLGLVGGTRGAARSTASVAIISVVVAASGTLSGLFGGLVGERLSQWHGDLFGLPLTYHGILFLLASVIRGLALFWLRGIAETRATPATAALRHMANDLVSTLQQTVATPVRGLGRWARHRASSGRPTPPS